MTDADWKSRRLHFVGIGGAGMSGWASVSAELGAEVSGSDAGDSPVLAQLRREGIGAYAGHDAARLPAGDNLELVRSTAVADENEEIVAARERGLRVMEREELLAELTAMRRTIAVAGAHGKTTTSSMIAQLLIDTGRDPGYLIGGSLQSSGRNARWGSGEWLVVEADESDKSLLKLHADIAVVTNIELDHHAVYRSLDELREVFREFLADPELAILPDDQAVVELRAGLPAVAFSVSGLELFDGGARFEWRGLQATLNVPGAHNAANAVAALEAAKAAGVPDTDAVAAISNFAGAGRRFERLGRSASGALIVDDYAHHPTEVAATIAAARTLNPERLVVVFQPHLFSRTEQLALEFGNALADADLVLVLDIYRSREDPSDFPAVSSKLIVDAALSGGGEVEVHWTPEFDDAAALLGPALRSGDLCLILGAGDVRRLGEDLAIAPIQED
ncbi:MAG: UDP-N-acetylmuramate--L-alanine ligase [Actinobacteria bacterium]|uniref:UDP-N-acetylmuramate--L-alanine ligase n=1 Tax=freshwater metagenome TaxID=449393 RepID=A0A6J5ZBG7_9ZZZZ|nr:UDP-N-acetylmuramate--L-alanine ligase [Actinomycetota bacterium]